MIYAFVSLLGIFLWTFVEYVMHRFNGHEAKGKTRFSAEHLKHHAQQGYFTALSYKISRGAGLGLLLIGVAFLVAGPFGVALALGFAGGYVLYEWFHWRSHVAPPRTSYGRWVRRHHFYHHFHDPRANHGVLTSLWDHVFGTFVRPEKIKVPAALALPWLIDDEGEIRAPFRDDYWIRTVRNAA